MAGSNAATVADYLAELPANCRGEIERVRALVNAALPAGYRESMAFGMIGWTVPLDSYPHTYNGQPLLYAGLAAHKTYNALYLTGVYASKDRAARFQAGFAAAGKRLDMGKSSIRFRTADALALDVVRDEIAALDPRAFIALCEKARASRAC